MKYWLKICMILFFISTIWLIKYQSKALAIQSQVKAVVTHSVFIGKNKFNIFGYTTPSSKVYLQGQGIEANTISDETGYFEFSGIFSPLTEREVCLYSVDNYNRRSYPICLPPFPLQYQVVTGPILIPPTIATNTSNSRQSDQVIISGQSIPNSQVYLSFYSQRNNNVLINYSNKEKHVINTGVKIPDIPIQSDSVGNYSVTVPSHLDGIFRIFSYTKYKEINSPASNKLTLKIYSWWLYFILLLLAIFTKFSNMIFLLIVISQVLFIIYFYKSLIVVKKNKDLDIILYPKNSSIIPYK